MQDDPSPGRSRFYPKPGRPALIYLPGLHGDWTLFTSFRTRASELFQVLELTYPRRLDWSLNDYADFALREAAAAQISSGWLLAESYGSQVAWPLTLRARAAGFQVEGVILAGGFARYPFPPLAAGAEFLLRSLPTALWQGLFRVYAAYGKFRHRHAPETRDCLREFVDRRTPEDLAAMAHRISLIRQNDPALIIRSLNLPVFLLAGAIDPIVFPPPALGWLRKHCPSFAGQRIIWRADHNVLGTEPAQALAQIREWIERSTGDRRPPLERKRRGSRQAPPRRSCVLP